MLAPLLASLLAVASPPRAVPGASLVVYVPRFDKLTGLSAFLSRAAKHSPILRSAQWRSEFHPLLDVDITRPESLAEAGIDPGAGATVSFLGDDRVTCTTLLEMKTFQAKTAQKLKALGEPWKSTAHGVALVGAKSAGKVLAGYALNGREACAVASAAGAEALLEKAAAATGKPSSGENWRAITSLSGSAFISIRDVALGIEGTRDRLVVEGRGKRLPLAQVKPVSRSPYGSLTPAGLLFVRAHADAGFQDATALQLQSNGLEICPACDAAQMRALIDAMVGNFTGDWMLRVESAKIDGTLRSATSRYLAVKHAYVAAVSDPAPVKRAIEAASRWKNARITDEGVALAIPGGEIQLGLQGRHVYVANDETALKSALRSLSAPEGALKHGADFAIDPRRLSKTLSQISLLDAIGSRQLAPLLAVNAELGPLLSVSDKIRGWVDSAGGGHRFEITWLLDP